MKFIFTFFALTSIFVTAEAAPRSFQSMKDAAASILLRGSQAKGNKPMEFRVLMSKENLTVIGSESGGYAIVSNDDANEAILGFSDGIFEGEANPGLAWYLSAADQSLYAAQAIGGYKRIVVPSSFTDIPEEVAPLLTCTWGQGAPYNLNTPEMKSGAHYVTGCVATAMAQILYHHKYPTQGQGINTYIFTPGTDMPSLTLTVDYSKEFYDWSLMRDSYKAGEQDAGAKEVAKLMYALGVSVNMQYTADGSGSYTYQAANALSDYFRCNRGLQMYDRAIYSEALWMKKIYQELNANRPVLYAGADMTIRSGHAFVFDGYRADGLVHVNWGWDGSQNSYFDVALLNPSGYKFDVGQEMILGIADTTIYIPYESQLAAKGDIGFTFSTTNPGHVTIRCSAYNYGSRSFSGQFGTILMDAQGNQEALLTKTLSSSSLGKDGYERVVLSSADYATALADKPDGVYRLYCGAKSPKDDDWAPVRAPENYINSYVLTKAGGNITWQEDRSDLWSNDVHVATGIRSLVSTAKPKMDGRTYNISGQRVEGSYKGIVVRNGKKMINR